MSVQTTRSCFVLKKHFDGDFTPDQEKDINFKRRPLEYQNQKLSLALNGLNGVLVTLLISYPLPGFNGNKIDTATTMALTLCEAIERFRSISIRLNSNLISW